MTNFSDLGKGWGYLNAKITKNKKRKTDFSD